jgi:hypothetical protein
VGTAILLRALADALDRVDAALRLVEVVLGLAGHELADESTDTEAAERRPRASFFAGRRGAADASAT